MELVFVSSAFLIIYKEKHLLATTAHSIDDSENFDGHYLWIGGAKKSFYVPRPFLVNQLPDNTPRNKDSVDFATIILTKEEFSKLTERIVPLPIDLFESYNYEAPGFFHLYSYPERDNKPLNLEKTLPSNCLRVPVRENKKFSDWKIKKNPRRYVTVQYDPHNDNYENLNNPDFEMPEPEGFSGSPLLRISPNKNYTVSGMAIEYHSDKKAVICLHANAMRDLIDRWWPSLLEIYNNAHKYS